MDIQDWITLIIAIVSAIGWLSSYKKAVSAIDSANTANVIAREANNCAHEANKISNKSLLSQISQFRISRIDKIRMDILQSQTEYKEQACLQKEHNILPLFSSIHNILISEKSVLNNPELIQLCEKINNCLLKMFDAKNAYFFYHDLIYKGSKRLTEEEEAEIKSEPEYQKNYEAMMKNRDIIIEMNREISKNLFDFVPLLDLEYSEAVSSASTS